MVKAKKRIEKPALNPKQELFCQFYAGDREFFGNGVQAYIEAYGIDLKRKGAYNAARACASELLTNPNVLKRINEIFEARGLNDAFVDKQLELLVTQNADFSAKAKAIVEYNKLKKRITKKVELSLDDVTVEKLKNLDDTELAKIAAQEDGDDGAGA